MEYVLQKEKAKELKLSDVLLRECAGQETEKLFKNIDMKRFIQLALPTVSYKKRQLREKINAQVTHLGYLDIKDDKYVGMAVVMSIDTKYSPRLTLYSLKNGTSVDCKIDKKTFRLNKLEIGDIVSILKHQKKAKLKRLENGTYEPISGVFDTWLIKYERLNNV